MVKKTGLVVYPREYVLGSGDKNGNGHDYVIGVDEKGRDVKVILKYSREDIARTYENKDAILTTIEMLSDTSRRAQRPCIADPGNGPASDAPEGMLLFERLISPDVDVKKIEPGSEVAQYKEENGVRTYVAGWVKVLSIDLDDFKPEMGVGYVETKFNKFRSNDDNEMAEHEARVKELNNSLANARRRYQSCGSAEEKSILMDDILRLRNEIDVISKISVSLVMMKIREIETLEANYDDLKSTYGEIRDKYTHDGRYGGVLLRVHNGNGVMVREMCAEICSRFNGFKEGEVVISSVDDDISGWMRFSKGRRILDIAQERGYKIDLIPIQKINCGGTGNATMNKVSVETGIKHNIQKIRLTYEDPISGQLAARGIVARVTSDKSKSNSLLGEAHTISEMIGDRFLMTKKPSVLMGEYSIGEGKIIKQPSPELIVVNSNINTDNSNPGYGENNHIHAQPSSQNASDVPSP